MADSQSSIVSIVGILAILLLVGLAAYFILGRDDEELEIDVGGQSSLDQAAFVVDETALHPAVGLVRIS